MIQKPKGTYDVFGDYGKKVLYLEMLFQSLMEKYNYEFIRTPIFEATDLFHRGVGETTDIVSKETYDFLDRGERKMTLRPEGTAGVVRSFIENKMYTNSSMPVKTWYYGPMFRYERPQAGRYREFYQMGVEAFGTSDPLMDAEVISIAVNFYKLLGLKDVKVRINSLGDSESRSNYRDALLAYFKQHLDKLCSDCKERYNKNPLRILDCKVDYDLDIMHNAPKISDYLSNEAIDHFEKVKDYLDNSGISYIVDDNLVRGLDYYTNTVFEVEADIPGFGANSVLCAGGRYDHLVENIGGPSTPGVGFALGMERLINVLEASSINLNIENGIDLYVIPMNDIVKSYAFDVTNKLRMSGFKVEMDYMNRNLKSNFKQADRLNSHFVAIIGEDEMANDYITIKNNITKEEDKIDTAYLVNYLDEKLLQEDCTCGDDCDCNHDHDCGCEHH